MIHGPAIATIAAAIGDPARATMLQALMHGQALTASELAQVAGVTRQTASTHLQRLIETELVCVASQGRHRYFRLRDDSVAEALESLAQLAPTASVRTGPRDAALRRARICYDHLAGELGVELYEALVSSRFIEVEDGAPRLTRQGETALVAFGIDVEKLRTAKRPLCRLCLDWSERRHHLAGSVGAALLARIIANGWARRQKDGRALAFSAPGEAALKRAFPWRERAT